MTIINMTQHGASPAQVAAGVAEPETIGLNKSAVQAALTIEDLPTAADLKARAEALVSMAVGAATAQAGGDPSPEPSDGANVRPALMIGGAPYLMPYIERAAKKWGCAVVYAFSRRESVDKVVGGKTIKTAVFRHLGFVEVA